MSSASIGVFDSGFGGLTVMNAIISLLPSENISYFADTIHLPYGNKSPEAILEYSCQSIEFLGKQGIKLLVIACHTSCVTALPFLQKQFPFPIIGIATAGIKALVSQKKTDHLAFLGTQTTVASGVYQKMIQDKLPSSKVTAIACPLFVPLVEMGYINHPILTKNAVQEHLRPLKKESVDAVLLACTHYPLLKEPIQKELGDQVLIIDPSMSCAMEVKKLLSKKNLLNRTSISAQYQFYVSDNPERFQTTCKLFFSSPITSVIATHAPSFL
jgi:glutamate racemase